VKQLRRRLTYANVMSTLAVFLVLGGATAVAAGLAKNSVGPKQLKKNAVTAAKIKKGAVTGAKVKPGSLKASNFAAGQLPAGPKGDRGEAGPSFGAYANDDCGSLEDAYEACVSTGSVNLPSSGPMLLIASAEWDNDESEDPPPNAGECRFAVDGQPLSPEISFGEGTDTHGVGQGGSISLNRITETLSAGSHTFAFECREDVGKVYNAEAMLSAVLLGSATIREVLPLP
jgi:hypothetical protein